MFLKACSNMGTYFLKIVVVMVVCLYLCLVNAKGISSVVPVIADAA
jgi:hypothetical protein